MPSWSDAGSPESLGVQDGGAEENEYERDRDGERDRDQEQRRVDDPGRERPCHLQEDHDLLVEDLREPQGQHDPAEDEEPAGRHRPFKGCREPKPSVAGGRFGARTIGAGRSPVGAALPGVEIVLVASLFVFLIAVGLAWAVLTGRLAGGPGADTLGSRAETAGRSAASLGSGNSPATTWRMEAAELAQEVQEVADTGEAPVADRDRLARQLVPLSAKLKSHSRGAPPAVDGELVEGVYALGIDCYEVGMEHSRSAEARTGVILEERLAELRRNAAALETTLSAQ
jgi:hypothetical protein